MAKKKNWAPENLPFSYEWVLILDADECLPPEAEAEITSIVSNPSENTLVTGLTADISFESITTLISQLEPSTF